MIQFALYKEKFNCHFKINSTSNTDKNEKRIPEIN